MKQIYYFVVQFATFLLQLYLLPIYKHNTYTSYNVLTEVVSITTIMLFSYVLHLLGKNPILMKF